MISACKADYKPEQVHGTWEITEIHSRGRRLSAIEAFGMKCITFKEYTYYSCNDVFPKGEWNVRGEMLRLHTSKVVDLRGKVLDDGHDSEWKIVNNKKWMVWIGTSRFRHQHLKVILKRKENEK